MGTMTDAKGYEWQHDADAFEYTREGVSGATWRIADLANGFDLTVLAADGSPVTCEHFETLDAATRMAAALTLSHAGETPTPEQTIARLRSEPDHPWHISRNADGGAAAGDFIRNAKARNARSQADKDASHREACLRVLDAMGARKR